MFTATSVLWSLVVLACLHVWSRDKGEQNKRVYWSETETLSDFSHNRRTIVDDLSPIRLHRLNYRLGVYNFTICPRQLPPVHWTEIRFMSPTHFNVFHSLWQRSIHIVRTNDHPFCLSSPRSFHIFRSFALQPTKNAHISLHREREWKSERVREW